MTLQEEVACSIDEANALLESNAKLSVALLAHRLKDMEQQQREWRQSIEKRIQDLEAKVNRIEKKAGAAFKEVRGELAGLKANGHSE